MNFKSKYIENKLKMRMLRLIYDVKLFLNSYFQMECGPNKCPQLVLFLLNILVFVSTVVENLNISKMTRKKIWEPSCSIGRVLDSSPRS